MNRHAGKHGLESALIDSGVVAGPDIEVERTTRHPQLVHDLTNRVFHDGVGRGLQRRPEVERLARQQDGRGAGPSGMLQCLTGNARGARVDEQFGSPLQYQ